MQEPFLFSIPDFCRTHSISRGMLCKLIGQGEGPATVKVGRRTLISNQAAQEWREHLSCKHGATKPRAKPALAA